MKIERAILSESNFSYQHEACSKIKEIALKIFQGLAEFFTFPTRYFGSKTWSIPGVIFKTPYLLFKKYICRLKIDFFENLISRGYHYKYMKKLSAAEAKNFLPYICACAFAFSSSKEWIEPFGYKIIDPKEVLPKESSFSSIGDSFVDEKTGLKFAACEKGDEVIVAFCGMNGLKKEMESETNKLKELNKYHHKAAIKNLLGFKDEFFVGAEEAVMKVISHPKFKTKKIILTGQCLGGTLAQYIALKNDIKAICFNTFQIGPGLQQIISDEKLAKADEYVSHVAAQGDFVNENLASICLDYILGLIGIRTAGNFGQTFVIPTPYETPKDIHEYILGSFMHHLGFDKKTKPAQIQEWIDKEQFHPQAVL